ncbi:hypothetical protein D3C85_957350 [compost metagenome]
MISPVRVVHPGLSLLDPAVAGVVELLDQADDVIQYKRQDALLELMLWDDVAQETLQRVQAMGTAVETMHAVESWR